jgi:hypothetical protein
MAAYLRDSFPARIAQVRTLLELTDKQLPEPAQYIDHPPWEVDKYPTVSVASTRMTGMRAVDQADGTREWEATYAVEVVGWVKGLWDPGPDGEPAVWDLRDDMIGALRRHFLSTPAFALGDGINARAEERGMAEEYGDPVKLTGEDYGLGGLLSLNLIVPESITRPPLGTVLQTAVTVHPALAD